MAGKQFRKNAASGRMGRRTADHLRRCQHFPDVYGKYEIHFYGYDQKYRYGYLYPLPTYRRGIKVANQRAEVIFEDEEGEMGDIFQDEMPFDMDAPVIDILPEDYGIWFVDAMDHPENYEGKTVKFKARVMKPRGMGSKFFVPGRTAMTCCADDTTFLGYVCKSAYAPKLAPGSWVEVTAKVAIEKRNEYQGEEGVVLYADHVEICEPLADEMVYFN